MAQGSIRKGFFFYFGLLVLLLVTVFLICLVIMMFNPGKTVLWMKYFSGDKEYAVTEETEGLKAKIDYSQVTDLTINCNYANVTVQRNSEYKQDYVVIINKAKGFSSAKKYTAFSYKATMSDGKLVIDINEPTGFIYFSKNIEVIINDNTAEGGFNFDNLALTVNAKGDSDVFIGGTTNKQEQVVGLRSLVATTDKGTITIGKMFKTSSVSGKFELRSQRGKIKALNNASFGTVYGPGINTNTDVVLGTNKGRINFDVVNTNNNKLTIECKRGTVSIGTVAAKLVDVRDCINGNYKFGKVASDMTFFGAADTIISPIINVNDIVGDFNLFANGKKDAPIINIKKAEGRVAVTAEKGSVTVSDAQGEVDINSTSTMSAKVTIDKNNSNKIRITNEKGKIYLHFLGVMSSDAVIIADTAKINVDFTKEATFTATCYKKDNTTAMASGNVHVNVGKDEVNYDYDKTSGVLTFVGSTSKGNLTINTNKEVNFNLVKAA